MWFPFTPCFSSSAPICVCVLVWLSAQTRFQVPWGSSLALPYGSDRAPHSQKDPGDLQLPPCFYCVPLAGSSAEAMLCQIRDFSPLLEQLLYLGGIPAAGGVGEDAGRLGRAALAGMLTAFRTLYWDPPFLLGATTGKGSVLPSTLLQTQIGARKGPAYTRSCMYCSVVVVYEIPTPLPVP